jgi:hypothetical protein
MREDRRSKIEVFTDDGIYATEIPSMLQEGMSKDCAKRSSSGHSGAQFFEDRFITIIGQAT